MTEEMQLPLRCDFCNKSTDEVKTIIAGPKVNICDECVDLSAGILAEKRAPKPSESVRIGQSGARQPTREERERLLDELGMCFAMSAIEELLAEKTNQKAQPMKRRKPRRKK